MDSNLAFALQHAIQAGDFEAARSLSIEYGKAVCNELTLAKNIDERTEILDRSIRTLRQQLHLARVVRSHISARLTATSRQHLYGTCESRDYTWQLNG
jgi:hypothetical protein